MIESMTGYGRVQSVIDGMNITVELKSVNHRYFEFASKIPRNYGFLDDKIKKYIQTRVARGKIDCYISIEMLEAQPADVVINHTLAAGYVKALTELAKVYDLKDDITATAVARYPEIFSVRKAPEDEDKIFNSVKQVLDMALDGFIEMRIKEGENLRNDILSRVKIIEERLEFIEKASPKTLEDYITRLRQRIKDLIGDAILDEQRILTEAAIFADKIAVAEETVRLHSHLQQLESMMKSDDAVGRKLDFLVQEINRETNTIGSKAQDVEIAKAVVDIKAEVEKIREQIQNIE